MCALRPALICFTVMIDIFYILGTLQIVLGVYGLWDGLRWLHMARKCLATHPGFYTPRVALICPCKGIESGLEQNLSALLDFDYPSYEVFFTLASSSDPAYEILRRLSARTKPAVHIVVAGIPEECGEKVNNLRCAVEQVGSDFEVLVFVDSDGRPSRNWLRHLVTPLGNPRLGAATTMRWYLPNRGFWSALAAAWNAPIATFLGEHRNNFCWGGGTAIRQQVFHQINALEFWRGSVSDDYSLTRALQHAGLRIHFVPECLVPTLHDTDFHGLMQFTNRQIIITRVHAPRLWAIAAAAHLLYCATLLLGIGLMLQAWIAGTTAMDIFLLALAVALLAAGKGYLRLMAVAELLPAWKEKLLAYGWAWTLLAALVPFIYLWNFLVAAFTRRIVWRGICYELTSPGQTRILSRA